MCIRAGFLSWRTVYLIPSGGYVSPSSKVAYVISASRRSDLSESKTIHPPSTIHSRKPRFKNDSCGIGNVACLWTTPNIDFISTTPPLTCWRTFRTPGFPRPTITVNGTRCQMFPRLLIAFDKKGYCLNRLIAVSLHSWFRGPAAISMIAP